MHLHPELIAQFAADPSALAEHIREAGDSAPSAAIAAGVQQRQDCIDALIAALADRELLGECAAWALGHLPSTEALLQLLTSDPDFDTREHCYLALAHLAARGGGDHTLAEAMERRINHELAGLDEGKSSLAEHALRVLALIGVDPAITEGHADTIIDRDRFCDRFEMQRLRKAVNEDGIDRESQEELSADWEERFAEAIPEPIAAEHVAPNEAPPTPAPEAMEAEVEPDETAALAEDMPAPVASIDWQAFAESDTAENLGPQLTQLVTQFGPMLDELAQRFASKNLFALSAEEFAGLILQVLPQAVPPQYVQALLSPQALNALQQLAEYVNAHEDEVDASAMIAGLGIIRQQIQAQLRASGSLHGSDYDEPASPGPQLG